MTKNHFLKSNNSCLFVFCLVWLSVFLFANSALSAELSFDPSQGNFSVNADLTISVILDTQGQSINAIEGEILFSPQEFSIKEISDGGSIISLWIARPDFSNEKGEISFSGIIPGGFRGENGLIFSMIFQAKKEGKRIIEIRDAKALLNDGKGTATNVKLSNLQFNIKDVGRPYISDVRRPEIKDKEPPEDFKPEITQNPEMFEGKYFLVFATQDKGSGIDRYEILESKINLRTSDVLRLIDAKSPYILKDQSLKSFIYVKAIDNGGNERVVVVSSKNKLSWYEQEQNWFIIILVLILTLGFFRKVIFKEKF